MEEKGAIPEVTIKSLYQKHIVDKFIAPPPPDAGPQDPKNINILDRYTWKDEWIDRLVKLKVIEPRGDYKEREKQAMLRKGGLQTNLGIAKIGRAMSKAEYVKRKYGAKKRATKEYL